MQVIDRAKPSSVIRKGKWKLIENLENGVVELFVLKNDISKKLISLINSKKKVVELKNELNNSTNVCQMPLVNENYIQ